MLQNPKNHPVAQAQWVTGGRKRRRAEIIPRVMMKDVSQGRCTEFTLAVKTSLGCYEQGVPWPNAGLY